METKCQNTNSFCRDCNFKNKDCVSLLNKQKSTIMAAVSFEVSDIKNALSVYFGINKPQTIKSIKGGHIMNGKMKKLFGMDFELGMSKDRNIASTLTGIAVRNPENGSWYVFDSDKHTRTNITGMKMGDFPVLLLPAQTLAVGDLIKMDGKYYYVQSIDKNYITLLGAADGIVRQILPEENIIPGMNFYTKVVAFDAKTLINPTSKENLSGSILATMLLMQWNNKESEFSLDNINDDSFNGLGKLLPILMASGTSINGLGNMFRTTDGGINLPLLMAIGNDSDEDDDPFKLLILTQLLGGNTGNNVNSMFASIPGIVPTVTSEVPPSDEVYCPSCGTTYSSDVKFCIKCGTHTVIKGKNCAGCGAILKDGASFCHVCGKKVLADVCPKCGSKITPDANFCPSCGLDLKVTSEAKPPTTLPVENISKSADTTVVDK